MNERDLYDTIKKRNIGIVINKLELELRRPEPTGATIHQLPSLRQYFLSTKSLYEDGFFEQGTFEKLYKENPDIYNQIAHKILVAVNEFRVKI